MWKGRLRVMELGSEPPTRCLINLEDKDSGELFAQCPYQPTKPNPHGGCEAVLDSSRYFVLTVVDQQSGQKAYVGMGFPERTESFDFNVALQGAPSRLSLLPSFLLHSRPLTNSLALSLSSPDWSKRQSPPKLSSNPSSSSSSSSSSTTSPHLPAGGSRDFSLKEGQTISIKLGGNSSIKKKATPTSDLTGGGGLGAFKLAPPPPPPPRGR